MFVKIAARTGVRPLLNLIWNARLAQESLYQRPANPLGEPSIELYWFECLARDVVAIRLYLAAFEHYGPEAFMALLEGRASI